MLVLVLSLVVVLVLSTADEEGAVEDSEADKDEEVGD